MVNNCLVTKLKAVVDNDNLMKIGTSAFSVGATNFDSNFGIHIAPKSGKTVTYTGKKNFIDISTGADLGTNTLNTDSSQYFHPATSGDSIIIDSIYDVENLTIALKTDVNIENLWLGSVEYLTISCYALPNATTKTLSKGSNLKELLINGVSGTMSFGGDISMLATLTNLEKLSLSETEVIGNIAALGALKMCSTFNLSYTGVSGELNDLIALLRQDRPSGAPSTARFILENTSCTYNGSAINDVVTITF